MLEGRMGHYIQTIAVSDVSIDPLGLALVYERLADRMLPGMTVRMRRPRFLTVLAVGASICEEYGPEVVAADGVTPPYLVFEWWIVEAYMRASNLLNNNTGRRLETTGH